LRKKLRLIEKKVLKKVLKRGVFLSHLEIRLKNLENLRALEIWIEEFEAKHKIKVEINFEDKHVILISAPKFLEKLYDFLYEKPIPKLIKVYKYKW